MLSIRGSKEKRLVDSDKLRGKALPAVTSSESLGCSRIDVHDQRRTSCRAITSPQFEAMRVVIASKQQCTSHICQRERKWAVAEWVGFFDECCTSRSAVTFPQLSSTVTVISSKEQFVIHCNW